MTFSNPFRYNERRNLRNPRDSRNPRECDGACEICPEKEVCGFSRVRAMRYSMNSESGNELELRLGDAMRSSMGSRAGRGYDSKGYLAGSAGFNNPARGYDSDSSYRSSASGLGYQDSSKSPGFHGSYDGKDGYAGLTPGASGNSYCGSCGKGYGGKK